VDIGPSESAVLNCKSISGANRVGRIGGLLSGLLIYFHADKVEIEVALDNDGLKQLVKLDGPISHVEFAEQASHLELISVAYFLGSCF